MRPGILSGSRKPMTDDRKTVAVLMSVMKKEPVEAAKDAGLSTEAVIVILGD